MTQAPATPELVKRLEDAAERHPGPPDGINRLLKQAAAALEAQQARIAELEAALRPFERAFRTLDTRFDEETKIMVTLPTTKRVRPTTYVYVEDVLRLRQALSSSQGRHEGGEDGLPELPCGVGPSDLTDPQSQHSDGEG